jgi:hypothetical protein
MVFVMVIIKCDFYIQDGCSLPSEDRCNSIGGEAVCGGSCFCYDDNEGTINCLQTGF